MNFGSRNSRVTISLSQIFPDLWNLEEPEDVGDHDGDAGEGGADDARDGRHSCDGADRRRRVVPAAFGGRGRRRAWLEGRKKSGTD